LEGLCFSSSGLRLLGWISSAWQCNACFYIALLYSGDPGKHARWRLIAFACGLDLRSQVRGICEGFWPNSWRNSCARYRIRDSIDWFWLNGTSLFLSC